MSHARAPPVPRAKIAAMTDIPTCFCGTFAVGRCVQCGEAVCHRHRIVVGEMLYCREHGVSANRSELSRRDEAIVRWQEATAAQLDAILDAFVKAMGRKGLKEVRVSKRRSEYGKTKWRTIAKGWSFQVKVPQGARESLYLTPQNELLDLDTGFPGKTDGRGFPAPLLYTGRERAERMLDKLGASSTIEQLSTHLETATVEWPASAPSLSLDKKPSDSLYRL